MSVNRVAKRSLVGGEIDPDLHYASDLLPVRAGAALCRNFIVRSKGGVERTPGTIYLGDAKTIDGVRLGRFVRARSTAYLVEWGPGYARMHEASAAVGAGHVDEIATPYGAADVSALQTAQSNDVQWVFSGGARIKELRRTGPAAFEFADSEIKRGPFLEQNADEGHTIQASLPYGTVTLTSSWGGTFRNGHVGAYWLLRERDLSAVPLWTNRASVTEGTFVRSNGRVYEALNAGETSDMPPSHEEGDQTDAFEGLPITWRYRHSGVGIVRITAVNSDREAVAEVLTRLPDQVASEGTWKWQEGAWSDHRGWPRTGALYSSALWAGGTEHEPYRLWKSAIEGFDDFEPGTRDDSAISRGLYDGETEAVRWMVGASYLAIGTEGPEWIARPESAGDVVRPTNLVTEVGTNEGASEIPGIVVSNRLIFTDAGRRRLTSMVYSDEQAGYVPLELSLLAGHLVGAGIVETVYQRRPWPVVWCLLEDGAVAGMTYLPEQEVLAWHRHDFGDPVQSITVLPVDGGRGEALFLAVRRGGRLTIERMADRFEPERGQDPATAHYLHSAVRYDLAAEATEFDGLDHLEGREVAALVDGKSHPPMTVTGGKVTLRFPGRVVTIGLPYRSAYKTLPFDMGQPDEFQAGRIRRVADLSIAFTSTLGGTVDMAGRSEAVFRLGETDLDAAPDLVTGVRRVTPPAACDQAQIEYATADPWPATITAIFPEYED